MIFWNMFMQEIMDWNKKIIKFVKKNEFYLLPTILALNAQLPLLLVVQRPAVASFWRWTPGNALSLGIFLNAQDAVNLVLNAQKVLLSGVQRPEDAPFWRLTPRWLPLLALNAQWVLLLGVQHPKCFLLAFSRQWASKFPCNSVTSTNCYFTFWRYCSIYL